MSMENIETNRLLLREFCINDVEECFINFGQDKEIGRYLPMYPVDDKTKMKNMIDGFIGAYETGAFIWLIVEKETQAPMGYISVDVPYRELGVGEIGYLLGEKFWGMGYATEAACAVIDFMFHKEGLHLIEAKYNKKNIASEKLLNRLQFTKEGVLRDRRIDCITGKKCDLVICSLNENEFRMEGNYGSKIL